MMKRLCSNHTLRMWLVPTVLLAASLVMGCKLFKKDESIVPVYPWFASIRETVLENIDDPGRARSALCVIDRAELDILEAVGQSEAHTTELASMYNDYDATREDFKTVFDRIDKTAEETQRNIQKHHNNLVAVIEPGEWASIMSRSDSLFFLYVDID